MQEVSTEDFNLSSIAVIGAGGFVGLRLIESLQLEGNRDIRAIIHSHRSLSDLNRFGSGVSIEIADAVSCDSISHVIEGCSTVINLVSGPAATIFKSTKAIYHACERKKVKRLVHLSSATVYGEVESAKIDDDSLPLIKHWMPYARAKSASELFLRNVLKTSSTEIIVLRPGIVWGPNSFHTMNAISSLSNKSAFLVNRGKGIFNSIYIDNLVDCISICCENDEKIVGFFNIADAEVVTWWDFYAALASHLHYDMEKIPVVSGEYFPFSASAVLEYIQMLPIFNPINFNFQIDTLRLIKSFLKSKLTRFKGTNNAFQIADEYTTPNVSREIWHLQKTRQKLPTSKFALRFNYIPKTSFNTGILKTINWLRQTGKL